MAIDRSGIAAALAIPGWDARATIRAPSNDPGAVAVIYPAWIDLSVDQRLDQARRIVRAWRERHSDAVPLLRIALPAGPGARILYARLHRDLGAAGIQTRLVPLTDEAELRLIDEVAPSGDPAWYLRRLSCGRGLDCPDNAPALIAALADADTPDANARAFAAAEEAITRAAGFIALGQPIRWSLTRTPTAGLRPNARARHSLIRLQPAPD
jgi:peptide/nickel transport system substrate-binding protein